MFEFKMPSLGADMVEGTLTSWNVEVGQHINRGEVICEVETAKGAIDVEIWESGVVTSLKIAPGQKVPVGEVIALLVLEGEKAPTPSKAQSDFSPETLPEPKPEAPPIAAQPTPAAAMPPLPPMISRDTARLNVSPIARVRASELGVDLQSVKGTGVENSITLADVESFGHTLAHDVPHRRVSPVARKMAEAHNIDLQKVEGHGPHGAVESADVEEFFKEAQTFKEAFGPERPAPKSDFQATMRQAVAFAMARSKREIPHYYLSEEISMKNALDFMEAHNSKSSVSERLLPAVFLIKAVAIAVRDVPEMNGLFVNDTFTIKEVVNPGFAISLKGGGVIPPAIFDAGSKSLVQIMNDLKDLVQRVRRGKLRSTEVTDATITITSLGELGVGAVYGVIYPPQVAIVGFGRITDRVFVHDGMMGIHPGLTATLSGDHRVSDGIAGARFLARIRDLLQTPEQL